MVGCRMWWLRLVLIFFYANDILLISCHEQPEATTSHGTILGKYMNTITNRKISAFLGIPYAKVPTGELRFQEPVSPNPWRGVLNATFLPSECLQYNVLRTSDFVHGTEDCLYLNIYVPEEIGIYKNNSLPVLVYIHGGAFMSLTSTYYGPEYLLHKDVILVTMNYRLGILGFISTGDTVVPGNNGLKDQQLALKWVKNNINSFGGDPGKITLSGMSSGGSSVDYHILSPGSKGLFSRAILLSGTSLCPWAQAENVTQKTKIIAQNVGCPIEDSKTMVECLKNRPAHHLVGLSGLFMVWINSIPFSPFGPVIEPSHQNSFIEKSPVHIIKNKLAHDVPMLVSTVKDDGLYPGGVFIKDEETSDSVDQHWDELMPFILDYNFTIPLPQQNSVSETLRKEYLGADKIKENRKAFIEMLSDRLYKYPISQSAKLYAANNKSPVYAMQFSYIGNVRSSSRYFTDPKIYLGTPHGDDISFVLRSTYLLFDKDEPSLEMSKRMVDLWITFINGTPFPKHWQTVNENLPLYSYLNVKEANFTTDALMVEDNYGRSKFWPSIGFEEDYE